MNLCVECRQCCNGSIFTLTHVREGEQIPIGTGQTKTATHSQVVAQPCPSLTGGGCSVYDRRPESCKSYECSLLRSVKAGRTSYEDALEVVQTSQVKHWKDPDMELKASKKIDESQVAAVAEGAIASVSEAHPERPLKIAALERLGRFVLEEITSERAAEAKERRGALARSFVTDTK